MSIMRCEWHNRNWDSDTLEACPLCDAEEANANREMGLESVTDYEIDEDDGELCSTHMNYRPCRTCRAQDAIERAEARKEEDR